MDSTELVFWAPTLVQALFTLLIALLAYMGRNIIKEIQENTQAIHTLRVEFFTELSNSRIEFKEDIHKMRTDFLRDLMDSRSEFREQIAVYSQEMAQTRLIFKKDLDRTRDEFKEETIQFREDLLQTRLAFKDDLAELTQQMFKLAMGDGKPLRGQK